MAEVQITKGETIVSLTLSEKEAMYVLGVLGNTVGGRFSVYRDLTRALRGAGYDSKTLYAASDKYAEGAGL